MPERKSWDEYFLDMADQVASRSPCVRRQVGAVIVREKAVLSTGYNGPPRRCPHPTQDNCVRIGKKSGEDAEVSCCVHAEANAVALAAKSGTSIEGATLYCQIPPCWACAKLLANAGISEVVWRKGDLRLQERSKDVFVSSGICFRGWPSTVYR